MENKIKYLMYLRKSTDTEDRQIQSIEDQKRELEKYAKQFDLDIVGQFEENKSAKAPGRIAFNKMLTEIKKGKANGILCWKINRLARNPVDGGEIQWLLQQEILQSIQTIGREYRTGDNVMMMSVELGMANQFVLDLSKDVKRGMYSKVEKGWRPGKATLGYKNDKYGEKGEKKVLVDDERFPLVRKMWDLMLTGEYSVPKIIDIANNEWGLRRALHKKEFKLHERHGYTIFTNPFYYGEFVYGGKIYQGKHKPMITPEEFDRVQKILGKKGKPQTRHKNLPYRGIIRCGECGCSITTEQKTKMIKAEGKLKTYTYHKCTKRKLDIPCSQKPIAFEELNKQVINLLDGITIPQGFLDFALEVLGEENVLEIDNRNILIKNQQKALTSCISKIDNLIKLYISPNNSNKDLISDDEFKEQKTSLIKEKANIQNELRKLDERVNEWVDLTEKTFKFATYAKAEFINGDFQTKTSILHALGSDFVFKDGILSISLNKQYQIIENGMKQIVAENPTLELKEFSPDKAKTARFEAVSAVLSG
jgi:site-specific DNA recombinase